MSSHRLRGCRKASRAKLRRAVSAGKIKIARLPLITLVRFSQECWEVANQAEGIRYST